MKSFCTGACHVSAVFISKGLGGVPLKHVCATLLLLTWCTLCTKLCHTYAKDNADHKAFLVVLGTVGLETLHLSDPELKSLSLMCPADWGTKSHRPFSDSQLPVEQTST